MPARVVGAAFVACLSVFVVHLAVAWVVAAVAVPDRLDYLVTVDLAEAFRFLRRIRPHAVGAALVLGGAGAVLMMSWVLLLNRHWISRATLHWKAFLNAGWCCLALYGLGEVLELVLPAEGVGVSLLDKELHSLPVVGVSLFPPEISTVLRTVLPLFALYLVISEVGLAGSTPRRHALSNVGKSGVGKAFVSAVSVTVALAAFHAATLPSLNEAMGLLPEAAFSFLDRSAEFMPRGAWVYVGSMVLLSGLPTATVAGVAIALAPGVASVRMRSLCLALALLPGIVGTAYARGFASYCLGQGEMGLANLTVAAGLAPAPPRVMVVAGPSGGVAISHPTKVDLGEVPATRENYERLVRYLDERGDRWTKHTAEAWASRGAILDHLLHPAEGLAERVRAAEEADSIPDGMIAIARLRHMPVSEESKRAAWRLLDPTVFALPEERGEAPAYLVDLALHAGDLALARRFWRPTGSEPGRRGEAAAPAELPWRGGRIDGQVVSRWCGPQGVRVGLYRSRSERAGETRAPGAPRLLAATETGEAGRFEFTGLLAGEYELALLLPGRFGSQPGRVEVEGSLGGFAISRASPAPASRILVESSECGE